MGKCTDTQFLPGGASGSGSGSRGSSARWRIWGSGRRDGGIWLCWTVGLLNSELWISSWISSCEFLLNWGESKQYLYDVHDISSFYIYIYIYQNMLIMRAACPATKQWAGMKTEWTDGWMDTNILQQVLRKKVFACFCFVETCHKEIQEVLPSHCEQTVDFRISLLPFQDVEQGDQVEEVHNKWFWRREHWDELMNL